MKQAWISDDEAENLIGVLSNPKYRISDELMEKILGYRAKALDITILLTIPMIIFFTAMIWFVAIKYIMLMFFSLPLLYLLVKTSIEKLLLMKYFSEIKNQINMVY